MTSDSVSLLILSCNDISYLVAVLQTELANLQNDCLLSVRDEYLVYSQVLIRNYVITLAEIKIKKPINEHFLQAFNKRLRNISIASFIMIEMGDV